MASTTICSSGFCFPVRRLAPLAAVLAAGLAASALAWGQTPTPSASGLVFTMSREQMIKYTAKNPYDRFPDGRPKVPDALLEKFQDMSSEEIGVSRSGYPSQFVDGLQVLHPDKKLIGRAVTLQLMPTRPDIADAQAADWRAQGNQRPRDHQNAIDLLQKGDVFVVDVGGSVASGGVIGDNLAYYILKNAAGFVIDGAIRDLDGISPLASLPGYYRGATPPAIHNVMVTGINIPIRIGAATVMPGDVVFGDKEGVSFIPPQLVQGIVDAAQITHIHDDWTKKKFDEGKYKSTEIYSRPRDPALLKEYDDYLKQKLGPQAYEEYRKNEPAQAPAPQTPVRR